MRKILYLIILTCSITYSQDKWELINNHDLKFKLPIDYSSKNTPNAKVYSYEDDNKIMTLSIFKNEAIKNLKESNENELKRYYKGIIDGYVGKSGSEILSSETYNFENTLAEKNVLKVSYQDGTYNLLEIHILYKNGLNYFATFQYDSNANQKIINDKDVFFNSFTFITPEIVKKNEGTKITLTQNDSYQLGNYIGKILSYILGISFVAFIIYFFFIKKKKEAI
ncbi:hypothetical protein [uncultured Dokdonia sp.]|uniref:hypothetical protein n=1 Tax=uncultured Dokdonia sp. TaxID=575653 RepID=UPI002631F0EB|nr:hypothetical protein [uncultured Dokdonia sp.]